MNLFPKRNSQQQVQQKERPKGLPSIAEVRRAIEILDAQLLYVYQILAEQELTSPGGFPLKVERKKTKAGGSTEMICISVLRDTTYDLFFLTDGTEGKDSILEKALMLVNVSWRKKPHVYACCPYAEVSKDVRSCTCPLHGESLLIPRQ